MGKRIFISYRHTEGEWVLNRLVPGLRAGGADVRVDVDRFKAGRAVVGQMDAEQDAAQLSVLVLCREYFQSDYCVHEFKRALQRDPRFQNGLVIPVLRDDVDWRKHITARDPPLLVNLRDDARKRLTADRHKEVTRQWALLMEACDADLGCDAPVWLRTRDEVLALLERDESVSLVVKGDAKWYGLVTHLRDRYLPDLGIVDLKSGGTVSRPGLVKEVLKAIGIEAEVPQKPDDLVFLHRKITSMQRVRLAILRFDRIKRPQYEPADLLDTLTYLVSQARKLVLLVQSWEELASLIPKDRVLTGHLGSTVYLKGVVRR